MFGMGMPEILLILAIALIVIGPKKLPELAKTLGRAMGEFKKAAQDFKRTMDVESTVKKFNEPAGSLKDSLRDAVESAKKEETTMEAESDHERSRGEKQQEDAPPK